MTPHTIIHPIQTIWRIQMVDFAKLKAQSGKQSLEKLTQELSKVSGNQQDNSKDDRFWYPNVDKAGNGYAVIRFLPAPGEEDTPFVRTFSHGFKGTTGSWMIENCPTTKGHKCPVCESNTELWNSGIESDKKIVSARKRKLTFISNVQVITDQQNPENEGKVFLFKYGKKVFDKLNDAMNPQFPGDQPVNPFDLWAGANFKLKIRKLDGYSNYDQSSFETSAPLADDDKLEGIWKQEYSLQEFLSPKNFKSYDDLKKRLDKVLSTGTENYSSPQREAAPWADEASEPKFKAQSTPKAPVAKAQMDEDEDEDFAFFKQLADSDD